MEVPAPSTLDVPPVTPPEIAPLFFLTSEDSLCFVLVNWKLKTLDILLEVEGCGLVWSAPPLLMVELCMKLCSFLCFVGWAEVVPPTVPEAWWCDWHASGLFLVFDLLNIFRKLIYQLKIKN